MTPGDLPELPLQHIENEPGPLGAGDRDRLREQVEESLRSIFDPEIPVNIFDLGLIYRIEVSGTGFVTVEMTLTSPGCPVAGSLPGEVDSTIREVPGVSGVSVQLTWDPPWSTERMSEAAKLELGFL